MVPAPRPAPAQYITAEMVALVDQLEQGWTTGAEPQPGSQARQPTAEFDLEPQA